MQKVLLQNCVASTGSVGAETVRGGGGYVGNSRTFYASVTNTGAVSVTVNFYQVLASSFKRLVATATLSQASPSAGIDLLNPGQEYLAEAVFSANPSNDVLTAIVEG